MDSQSGRIVNVNLLLAQVHLQHHRPHVRRQSDQRPARHHRAEVPRPAAAGHIRDVRHVRVRHPARGVHTDVRPLPVSGHPSGPGHSDRTGRCCRVSSWSEVSLQDYVLVESGCTCRPKYATPGTDPNPQDIIPNFN